MSTQFTVSPSLPESLVKSGPGSSELCTSILPSEADNGIITKDIPAHHVSLTIRPLTMATDVPLLFKWMGYEFLELEEFYNSMIESDFSQPFMGLVNEIPICQIDVYKARQGAISLYYEARTGDYALQLVIAPMTAHQNLVLLLQTCLEYFFSFQEVGRVVTDVEIGNEWNNHLFDKVGFVNTQEVYIPYKPSNLYICTRESFRQANSQL